MVHSDRTPPKRRERAMGSPTAALMALLIFPPATGLAGEFELSGWIGPSLPFYSQSFTYQPPPVPPLPGFSVEQLGEFHFDASGGLSFGGGLAWHGAGPIGVELRVDTAAVKISQDGASFRVMVRPPAPLPPLSFDVDTSGSATISVVPIVLFFIVLTMRSLTRGAPALASHG
jgi:hypothetical protein